MGEPTFGRAQIGAAAVTILVGVALWAIDHAHPSGPQEWVLGVGAICALVAAGAQHGIAWPARRRLAEGKTARTADRRQVAIGQRVAALLLTVTVAAMVLWRYA